MSIIQSFRPTWILAVLSGWITILGSVAAEQTPPKNSPATSADSTPGTGRPNSSAATTNANPAPGGSPDTAVSPGAGGPSEPAASDNNPTPAQADTTTAGSQTNLLARLLGIEDAPVKVYGWSQNSYAGNFRTYLSTTGTRKWTDKLTEAAEVFFVHETNVPGLGPDGTVARESAWYGFTHWFLYDFTDKIQGVYRAEVFRDNNGAVTGQADNYYEMTLGLPYKPKPWLWIRPEARYDWAQYKTPFSDGTRGSQLTLAFDVIVQF